MICSGEEKFLLFGPFSHCIAVGRLDLELLSGGAGSGVQVGNTDSVCWLPGLTLACSGPICCWWP